jgi:hypothetical protein
MNRNGQMKFAKTNIGRFGFAFWASVLGIVIVFHGGCKSEKTTNSNTANSNVANPKAANSTTPTPTAGQAQTASTPAASAAEARRQRESGKRNDPGAGAVGRPMNPEKFGPPK